MTEDFTQACDVMQDATRAMRKVAEAILKQPAAVVNVAPKGPDVVINQPSPTVSSPVTVESAKPVTWKFDIERDSYGKIKSITATPS